MADRVELLQGILDLLILRTLQLGPADGHAIAKAIEHSSEDVLLEEGTSENNRKAKFYRLTAKGKKQLALETSKWEKFVRPMARVLRPA
jgi:PadR family transcriptional regulator, regulatory protein PadR